jgi:hypothetical protein
MADRVFAERTEEQQSRLQVAATRSLLLCIFALYADALRLYPAIPELPG